MNLFEYIQPLSLGRFFFLSFLFDAVRSHFTSAMVFRLDTSTNASSNDDRPVIVVIVLAIMHVSVIQWVFGFFFILSTLLFGPL